MNGETHVRLDVGGPADIGAATRLVTDLAAGSDVDGEVLARAVLGATELASNLARHDLGGYLLARALHTDPGKPGIEVISVDSGPGPDLCEAALDAFRRSADVFDAWSPPRHGAVVLARYDPGGGAGGWEVGAVSVALVPGEGAGDRWAVRESGTEVCVLVVDGLGHGRHARASADAALGVFETWTPDDRLDRFVLAANVAMRATTRGGVLTICCIRPDENAVHFAGVGNVSARVVTPAGSRILTVNPGTAGTEYRLPAVGQDQVPFPAGSTLVVSSDGLDSAVDLAPVGRMADRHAALIAAVLHRDHADGRDDATVVVVRDRRVASS
jgi:stage II sporulation SpoE-like protein